MKGNVGANLVEHRQQSLKAFIIDDHHLRPSIVETKFHLF